MCSGEPKNINKHIVFRFTCNNETDDELLHRYKNRPVMSGPGLYDPTSIMNAGLLFVADFFRA